MAVMKHSRQREAIKADLMRRRDHPTADMVYADIREKFPNISLGTVYRNLSLLTELGEIRRLAGQVGGDRYDGNTEPHGHFICRSCGAVMDLAPVNVEELAKHAAQPFDGVIEECRLTFIGLCGACRGKAAEVSRVYDELA